jgi:hypothetical protein
VEQGKHELDYEISRLSGGQTPRHRISSAVGVVEGIVYVTPAIVYVGGSQPFSSMLEQQGLCEEKPMKVNCVSCGHNMTLDDAYENFEGLVKCWVCGGLFMVKIAEGEVKSVNFPGVQCQPAMTKTRIDLENNR